MIGLDAPVVQAPLAGGPSTPELAAAVSNAGGLGFVAAGYLSAAALDGADSPRARADRRAARRQPVRARASEPVDDGALAAYASRLAGDAERYGVELGEPRFDDDELRARSSTSSSPSGVPVVSTTFAGPPPELRRARARGGCRGLGDRHERRRGTGARTAGADVLVVQGAEAGGHRGAWSDDDGPDLGLLALLSSIDVSLPLVAAGGIADAARAAAPLTPARPRSRSGPPSCSAPRRQRPHRTAPALAAGGETAITRAFTGRRARGIVNEFMRAHPDAPSAYPQVHHLTAPLRAAARAAGDCAAHQPLGRHGVQSRRAAAGGLDRRAR